MYRRHKLIAAGVFFLVMGIAFFFDWQFKSIAEASITVASIAMGMYIAAVSVLLGSPYAKKLKSTTDDKLPTKTHLGVLAEYFHFASTICVLLIISSSMFLISYYPDSINKFVIDSQHKDTILKMFSAWSYAIFAENILMLKIILIFLINSLGRSVEEQ